MEMTEEEREKFHCALDVAAITYSKFLPDEQTASNIKQYCEINCSAGQKTSRIINAICKKFGVDKHLEYNMQFAKLADSLNPLQIKRTALLSVHPCDYLEMSNRDNSWSSCHCLDGGEYHGGTLSYMNDGCSMIFYTVDDDIEENYHTVPKRARQVFCFNDGILLQSRLYPQTDDEETRTIYRNIVQKIIADCMILPNLWTLKREHDSVNYYVRTHEYSLHYKDYDYKQFKSNISLLNSVNISAESHITIGSTAYCMECCDTIFNNKDGLHCESHSSEGYVICYNCDRQVHEDNARYIGGYMYCDECCNYCDHCEEYATETWEVHRNQTYAAYVCSHCLEHYRYCDDCDEYFEKDCGIQLGKRFHCNDCIENDYYSCTSCAEYVVKYDSEEIDGQYYCKNCADSIKEENNEYLVSA
jgi:formylmethanofuran dehydrogenase subunit E